MNMSEMSNSQLNDKLLEDTLSVMGDQAEMPYPDFCAAMRDRGWMVNGRFSQRLDQISVKVKCRGGRYYVS